VTLRNEPVFRPVRVRVRGRTANVALIVSALVMGLELPWDPPPGVWKWLGPGRGLRRAPAARAQGAAW
jgi:hypothetical protein